MFINITVKTNQKVSNIEKSETGEYKVFVKSLPQKNKANLEIIDILSKYFDVNKSQIKIKSGKYSTKKRIFIDDQIRLEL